MFNKDLAADFNRTYLSICVRPSLLVDFCCIYKKKLDGIPNTESSSLSDNFVLDYLMELITEIESTSGALPVASRTSLRMH